MRRTTHRAFQVDCLSVYIRTHIIRLFRIASNELASVEQKTSRVYFIPRMCDELFASPYTVQVCYNGLLLRTQRCVYVLVFN